MTRVLLVGAGHAHVEVLRRFGRRPVPGARLTLLTRGAETPYSGMLPGVVAGLYRREQAFVDVAGLAAFAGAALVLGEACGVDMQGRRVLVQDQAALPFDVLSMDVGSRPTTGGVPGATEHALPVKPIDGYLERFGDVMARVRAGRARDVVMVGGGAGGVELLLSVEARLRGSGAAYTLVSAAETLLPEFPAAFRARFAGVCRARGIRVLLARRVVLVEPGAVLLEGGERLAADEVLWTTEAAPPAWLGGSGLPLRDGFLAVDARLQAAPAVFAAGDMIAFGPRPIPRSGVYAVRAGPILAHNLRAAVTGGRMRRFRPPRQALAIVTTGERDAVMARNGFTLEGAWVWWFKSWLDRRWMARYSDLPALEGRA